MAVYTIDPLSDPRWDALVESHPSATVFHSRGWLEALKQAYGWNTVALTTTGAGEPLANGWPVCQVKTWLGKKLVSLPFSDHCEPLAGGPEDVRELLRGVEDLLRDWHSVEMRPATASLAGGCTVSAEYVLHMLDVRPSPDSVFRGFHDSCTRRPIRRAEREGVELESGRSPVLIEEFFSLFTMTRRRHGVPPPSPEWFRTLAATLRERFTILLARKNGHPAAAIVTLAHGRTLTYKYGGSDARFHPLGVMPFLFWRAIQAAKAAGMEWLDLGRSDLDQAGLIAFKDHLGASRRRLLYYRVPPTPRREAGPGLADRAARAVFARMPLSVLAGTGRLLYPFFA